MVRRNPRRSEISYFHFAKNCRRHIKNVFEEGELRPEGTIAKSAMVQTEGGKP
jgi:hypothetical protein